MRTLFATAALLLVSAVAAGQEAPKPLAIALEPLGDRDGGGVVARVFFRFANPREVTEAGLFLEGSFKQAGHLPRNFRFNVSRKGDKMIWHRTLWGNGKLLRHTQFAVLPDKRNELSAVHTFDEGTAEIEVRLVLEGDYGHGAQTVAAATETFTLAKTNQPYVVAEGEEEEEEEAAAAVPEEPATPESLAIRVSHRSLNPRLFTVNTDVQPAVKRVEYWVDDKRICARNTAPYTAEFDLGDEPKGVTLRAIGVDGTGRYVDADAYVVNEDETLPGVKITRTATHDGLTHFKVSFRVPKGKRVKSVALYAGDRKLYEWDRGPCTLSVSTASLEGVDSVRAVVIDDSGSEATDQLTFVAKATRQQ